jgi:hypothetical protein
MGISMSGYNDKRDVGVGEEVIRRPVVLDCREIDSAMRTSWGQSKIRWGLRSLQDSDYFVIRNRGNERDMKVFSGKTVA